MKPAYYVLLLSAGSLCSGQGQQPEPQEASLAVIRAFDDHNIVMFGEAHGCEQEYEWLRQLVIQPGFADRVDDIVVEFGNSLYQEVVDRYIAGGDVPFEQVQLAWRNTVGTVNAPSPVYGAFYRAVREANLNRRGKHQMRIVIGGPSADWEKINRREELEPFLQDRNSWYARAVKEEVLDKKRRALLIMGELHFLRRMGPGYIEQQLRDAGANTYLIVFGTQVYEDPEKRFEAWPVPAIVELRGSSAGDLPAMGANWPGPPLKLSDAADALLYVAHKRDELTVLFMPRAELENTAYGKEMDRRIIMQTGRPLKLPDAAEGPLP
jgi:hypothetical protein